MRFPGRRFYWSELSELPKVGPLIGTDQSPFHGQLLMMLETEFGLAVWEAESYGGSLELVNGAYRLGDDADGRSYEALQDRQRAALLAALRKWAMQEGVQFEIA